MNGQSLISTGPEVLGAFADARFALVGFEQNELACLSAFLGELGSLTQRIFPHFTAPDEIGRCSAVLLNLGAPLVESPWIEAQSLEALKTPVLAIGTGADMSCFPAVQLNAADLLFRPFSNDELMVRMWRLLLRTAPVQEHAHGRKPRILIADDDAWIVKLTSGILRGRGFECHEAKNGNEALRLARTLLPDLLILDIEMPFVNGLEILTALRKDPSTSAMKILLFTSADSPDSVRRGCELGANSYLCKPFKPFDFLKHVRTLLPGLEPAVQTTTAPGLLGGYSANRKG